MTHSSGIPVWRDVGSTTRPTSATEDIPVLIVGAGPVGLTIALDLAQRGRRCIILNRHAFVAAGSKAICFSKRTLDIWNRLGVGQAMVERGVVWNVGKVFRGASKDPIYQFDMLPVKEQGMPGFINLQQYHAEDILISALQGLPEIDLRWAHELTGVEVGGEGVRATVATAEGDYRIDADWMIACDGARSPTRALLGLDFEGRAFEDNFLIADVRLKSDRPAERWFWFDPPFNPGRSALLHKQPDDVWRLDFQLGQDIDREACVRPENVAPLVRGLLGDDADFEPVWTSVYTFQCRRMARFIHDRVIFAGDSAHLVSPFGARGCNGGIADADNLVWKLDLCMRGVAGPDLLASYDVEAGQTADENLMHSTRSTDFMTPPSDAARLCRDAVLDMAARHAPLRAFVNSGRLSTAVAYASPLSTPDEDSWDGGVAPGSVALDAPLGEGWLLEAFQGRFVLLTDGAAASPGLLTDGAAESHGAEMDQIDLAWMDGPHDVLRDRYDLKPGGAYLFRPDQYVCARWRQPDADAIGKALKTACGR